MYCFLIILFTIKLYAYIGIFKKDIPISQKARMKIKNQKTQKCVFFQSPKPKFQNYENSLKAVQLKNKKQTIYKNMKLTHHNYINPREPLIPRLF